jgi:hypothetical protein
MNRTVLSAGITIALTIASNAALAANANTSQKGSLLIYPKIDVRAGTTTWVRLVNDGLNPVTVKCYYMDVLKNRVDFEFALTKNQPVIFDARTGYSPTKPANAFPAGPGIGELVCFAVSNDGTALRNFNNLAGTATVVVPGAGASEYNAWAFKFNASANAAEPGAGDLKLTGQPGAYDSCPAYLFGQFSPRGTAAPGGGVYGDTIIDISSCKQDLRQDYTPHWTKLQFDVWRSDETRYTGAYHCADSFVETALERVDVAPQNFTAALLRDAAYYRVQGVASTQCDRSGRRTEPTGLVGVQTSALSIVPPRIDTIAAELAASNTPAVGIDPLSKAAPGGKIPMDGFVQWDAFGGREAPRR